MSNPSRIKPALNTTTDAMTLTCDACGWTATYRAGQRKQVRKAIGAHLHRCAEVFDRWRCACDAISCAACPGDNPECECGHGLG